MTNAQTYIGVSSISSAAEGADIVVSPALRDRNPLTAAFRPILAIPHLLLVGGPAGFALGLGWRSSPEGPSIAWGAGPGVLGTVALVIAIIAWFALVFGYRYPSELWKLAAYYLRWRVRAVAYLTLLRDEYPPLGDGSYPVTMTLDVPVNARNRVTVAFRLVLVLPHLLALCLLSIVWAVTTFIAWVSIIVTGNFPPSLYHFGVGMLRWSTRVEAYMLLLRDEYPPFSLT